MSKKAKRITITLWRSGLIIGISLIALSCAGVKAGSTKSGKNLYQTFYVGDEGTQYFIKPLKLATDPEGYLALDATFRYKDEVKDSATINISFVTGETYKSIDSLKIENGDNAISAKEMKLVFVEREKTLYESRFFTKIALLEFKTLFKKNNWKIGLYKNGTATTYFTAAKKTRKKIDKLNYEIFELF